MTPLLVMATSSLIAVGTDSGPTSHIFRFILFTVNLKQPAFGRTVKIEGCFYFVVSVMFPSCFTFLKNPR